VENVERQDEREQELRSEVDDLQRQGDELEGEAEKVDQQIDETRDDFEQKKQSSEAPGIQGENALIESHGSDVDPRPGTSETPGAADDEGQATGNPPQDDSPAGDEDDS